MPLGHLSSKSLRVGKTVVRNYGYVLEKPFDKLKISRHKQLFINQFYLLAVIYWALIPRKLEDRRKQHHHRHHLEGTENQFLFVSIIRYTRKLTFWWDMKIYQEKKKDWQFEEIFYISFWNSVEYTLSTPLMRKRNLIKTWEQSKRKRRRAFFSTIYSQPVVSLRS